MQLSPNSTIPVSYSTTIPGDTTLYYVQAVLRDTQSSTILQTLNLKNVSSVPNRYTGNFNPVSDPSGLGRPVDITISVYTDSGYTTLSNNYQIVQYNYVILQPWIQNLGMGGGLNIDYEKLQKMFDGSKVGNEEIGNEVSKRVKTTKVDYDRVNESIMSATEGVRTALSEEMSSHIKMLSDGLSELSKSHGEFSNNHSSRLEYLEKKIQDVESGQNEGQKLSYKSQNQLKSELLNALSEFKEEHKGNSEESSKENKKMIGDMLEQMQQYLSDNLAEKEIKMVYNMNPQKREKEKSEGYSMDHISALLR